MGGLDFDEAELSLIAIALIITQAVIDEPRLQAVYLRILEHKKDLPEHAAQIHVLG